MCAGVGGRRPSPPQRASTSCAPPPPEGEGDGRGKGRGLRAEAPGEEGPGSGQARRGTGQSPHAPEAGPPEHRPRGTAQGPPRGEWRAAPPVGRWPDRGAAEAAASAQERPASGPAGGAGRRQRTPANGGGCPCAPPCSPRRRPPEGASTGQAGHGAGARAEGSRRKAGPQQRPPDAPLQGAPSTRDGVRRKRKAPRPWPGRFREGKLLAESTPCGSIVPQRRRCCQAPEGGGPLLDIRTLFRQRGALTGHCLGLPRPGRDDVPFPSAS